MKKAANKLQLLCPEQDSNLHAFDGASPSSWCVYQFHHLGINSKFPFLFRSPATGEICARNRTRTCTSLRTLVPETSASTNSAIRAFRDLKKTISERRLGCKNNILFRKNNLSHKKTVPAYTDRDLVKP